MPSRVQAAPLRPAQPSNMALWGQFTYGRGAPRGLPGASGGGGCPIGRVPHQGATDVVARPSIVLACASDSFVSLSCASEPVDLSLLPAGELPTPPVLFRTAARPDVFHLRRFQAGRIGGRIQGIVRTASGSAGHPNPPPLPRALHARGSPSTGAFSAWSPAGWFARDSKGRAVARHALGCHARHGCRCLAPSWLTWSLGWITSVPCLDSSTWRRKLGPHVMSPLKIRDPCPPRRPKPPARHWASKQHIVQCGARAQPSFAWRWWRVVRRRVSEKLPLLRLALRCSELPSCCCPLLLAQCASACCPMLSQRAGVPAADSGLGGSLGERRPEQQQQLPVAVGARSSRQSKVGGRQLHTFGLWRRLARRSQLGGEPAAPAGSAQAAGQVAAQARRAAPWEEAGGSGSAAWPGTAPAQPLQQLAIGGGQQRLGARNAGLAALAAGAAPGGGLSTPGERPPPLPRPPLHHASSRTRSCRRCHLHTPPAQSLGDLPACRPVA